MAKNTNIPLLSPYYTFTNETPDLRSSIRGVYSSLFFCKIKIIVINCRALYIELLLQNSPFYR
jgi:hypothetical protein